MKTITKMISCLLVCIIVLTLTIPTTFAQSYNEQLSSDGTYSWSSPSSSTLKKSIKPGQKGGTLRTYVNRKGKTQKCQMSFRWDSPTIGINKISWSKILVKSNNGKTIYKTINAGSKSFTTSKNVTVPLSTSSQTINIPTNVEYCLVYVQNASFYMMYGGPYNGYAPANTLNIRVKIN